jgi:threonyl-tRNA synthetase
VWLSPVQAVGIPVADEYADHLQGVLDRLRAAGVRVELDASDDRMQKKIRNHTLEHVPFLLIAGEKDRDADAVSFRFRDGTMRNGVPVEEAVALITGAIRSRLQVSTADDLEPAGGVPTGTADTSLRDASEPAAGAPGAAAVGAV